MDMINEAIAFKHSLYLLKGWKQKITSLKRERDNELMVINHKMSGLSHDGVELTEEQAKSDKPMPGSSNHGQGIRYVNLIEKKDEIKAEYQAKIDHYQFMVDEVENVLNAMDERDRKMTIELYVRRRYTAEWLANEYGYTPWGLKKHINKAINRAKSCKCNQKT